MLVFYHQGSQPLTDRIILSLCTISTLFAVTCSQNGNQLANHRKMAIFNARLLTILFFALRLQGLMRLWFNITVGQVLPSC